MPLRGVARRSKAQKGGAPRGRVTPRPSGRYTPPIPRAKTVSPPWVPFVLLGLLIGGMLVILLNYLGLLPGGTKNEYLLGGLALITVGFVVATTYR